MKKKLLIMMILLSLTGCTKKEEPKIIKNEEKPKIETKVEEEKYEDLNNLPISVFVYQNNLPVKVHEYKSNWINGEDISYFTMLHTDVEQLSYEPFAVLYERYKNGANVKNGIMIEFEKGEEKIKKTIINPADVWQYFDYVQVYLYDDILHQNDSWYSHITEEEFNDNTNVTTFKITAGYHMDEVTSDVVITAFSYDSEDDFKDGFYRGNSSYQIVLKRN